MCVHLAGESLYKYIWFKPSVLAHLIALLLSIRHTIAGSMIHSLEPQ
jgi:hypothetical protein